MDENGRVTVNTQHGEQEKRADAVMRGEAVDALYSDLPDAGKMILTDIISDKEVFSSQNVVAAHQRKAACNAVQEYVSHLHDVQRHFLKALLPEHPEQRYSPKQRVVLGVRQLVNADWAASYRNGINLQICRERKDEIIAEFDRQIAIYEKQVQEQSGRYRSAVSEAVRKRSDLFKAGESMEMLNKAHERAASRLETIAGELHEAYAGREQARVEELEQERMELMESAELFEDQRGAFVDQVHELHLEITSHEYKQERSHREKRYAASLVRDLKHKRQVFSFYVRETNGDVSVDQLLETMNFAGETEKILIAINGLDLMPKVPDAVSPKPLYLTPNGKALAAMREQRHSADARDYNSALDVIAQHRNAYAPPAPKELKEA